jgi:predicted RNA-binding protein (virulence factor B family)
MSNLRSRAVAESKVFELLDEKNELMLGDDQKPQTVELFSPGSKQYVKARSDQNNRLVARLQDKKAKNMTPEEQQEEHARFLADCTKGFSANVHYIPANAPEDAQTLTGDDLKLAIYKDYEIGFIAEYVNALLGKWGNFTKASTKS